MIDYGVLSSCVTRICDCCSNMILEHYFIRGMEMICVSWWVYNVSLLDTCKVLEYEHIDLVGLST